MRNTCKNQSVAFCAFYLDCVAFVLIFCCFNIYFIPNFASYSLIALSSYSRYLKTEVCKVYLFEFVKVLSNLLSFRLRIYMKSGAPAQMFGYLWNRFETLNFGV